MKKETVILASGEGKNRYCAFPSITETNGHILCAWKQGTGHASSGDAAYLEMTADGEILRSGVIPNTDGAIWQNTELIKMPDGSAVCWIDKQNGNNKRLGAQAYRYTPAGFEPIPGGLTDTEGKRYGYVFDGTLWNGRYYLLAMTFPELDAAGKRKTVELLSSEDGGTWRDELCLDAVCNYPLNESSFAAVGDTLFILCRSYRPEAPLIAVDGGMNVLRQTVFGEENGICSIGRPKLFIKDGGLYGIMRNHRAAKSPMELALLQIDPETLSIVRYTVLDDEKPADGYYAEPYFDGASFNVVTYRISGRDSSDILLLRYDWGELS